VPLLAFGLLTLGYVPLAGQLSLLSLLYWSIVAPGSHENGQQMFTTSGGTWHVKDSNGGVAMYSPAPQMKNTLAGPPRSCDDVAAS
jgi:hypothetical protein